MTESGVEEAFIALGKRLGSVRLELTETVAEITIVDGDTPDSYHLAVTMPFKGTRYGKQIGKSEALKMLRQAKSHYGRLMRQAEKDIQYIQGVTDE